MKNFQTMSDLVADAEDLLLKLPDSDNPEIHRLRGKLDASIDAVRGIIRNQGKERSGTIDGALDQAVTYLQKYPAIAIAAAVASAAGALYWLFSQRDQLQNDVGTDPSPKR